MQIDNTEQIRNYIDREYLLSVLSTMQKKVLSVSKGLLICSLIVYAVTVFGIVQLFYSLIPGIVIILICVGIGTGLILLSKSYKKRSADYGAINLAQPSIEIKTVQIADIGSSKLIIDNSAGIESISGISVKYSDGTIQRIRDDDTLYNAVRRNKSNFIGKECYLFLIDGVLLNDNTIYYTSIFTLAPELRQYCIP